MMVRDDTFWGRVGQISLDGLAYLATAIAAAPIALIIAFFCVSSGS